MKRASVTPHHENRQGERLSIFTVMAVTLERGNEEVSTEMAAGVNDRVPFIRRRNFLHAI
jgi:hypothetical protein